MNSMRSLACAVVTVAVLLAAAPGRAQDQQPQGAGRGSGANAPGLTAAELERWFDSYVLLQAQDTLKLTDAQFARMLPPLKALQSARRRHLQARRQILNAMAGLVKANPVDEAALRDRLKGLKDLEARFRDEIQRAYDSLDDVLDPAQQARFRLFEEQVERRKIDLLMRARQRASEQTGTPRGR
jgi:Spy/CpxP family protein refolding chaperone